MIKEGQSLTFKADDFVSISPGVINWFGMIYDFDEPFTAFGFALDKLWMSALPDKPCNGFLTCFAAGRSICYYANDLDHCRIIVLGACSPVGSK